MAEPSIWRLQGRFASATLFTLLLIPVTFLAFVIPVSTGLTFSGLAITTVVTIHVALASAWVLMLASQAWFARTGRIPLHRSIGRTSYVLAPAVIVTFALVYFEFMGRRAFPFAPLDYQFDVYNIFNPLGFALCWGLAIYHRKRTPLHMRYMIATMFAIGSAIVFRILLHFFGWVPGFDNFDVLVVVTALILVLPLGILVRSDRRQGIAFSPYWVPLISNVVIVIGFFWFSGSAAWIALVDGLARLNGIGV